VNSGVGLGVRGGGCFGRPTDHASVNFFSCGEKGGRDDLFTIWSVIIGEMQRYGLWKSRSQNGNEIVYIVVGKPKSVRNRHNNIYSIYLSAFCHTNLMPNQHTDCHMCLSGLCWCAIAKFNVFVAYRENVAITMMPI
jgi:hypothetical protein